MSEAKAEARVRRFDSAASGLCRLGSFGFRNLGVEG